MIRFEHITKTYRKKSADVSALDDVSLEIATGEFVSVRGSSGSGKTTLLLTTAGMLRPSSGRVLMGDRELYALPQHERATIRSHEIGFVFQMFHLVPYLNVLDNVLLAGTGKSSRDEAIRLLDQLGMAGRAGHHPAELSAGECQRTALARAFLNSPKLILADEPTGNLDPENATVVMEQLKAYQQLGGTVIVATHSERMDEVADRVVHLDHGRLQTIDAGN